MAFKSAAQAKNDFEKKVAEAEAYRVTNGEQAKALFLYLKSGKDSLPEKLARTEKTRRHIDSHPDDLAAKAGMAVYEACDPVKRRGIDQAILDAETVLGISSPEQEEEFSMKF